MKKLSIILVIAALSICTVSAQQLSQLTMFNRSLMLYNPAFAGSEGALNLTLFHRSQWSGLEGAPASQALLADAPLFRNMALGASVYNDKLGPHDTFKFTGNGAYKIGKSHNNYFAFGVQVGYSYIKSDYSQLADQSFQPNDPQLQGVIIQEGTPEFGAGLALVKPKFSLGVSALNLAPKESVISDSASVALGSTNYFVYGQYKIDLNPTFMLSPSFLVKYIEGLPVSYDANIRVWYKEAVMAGVNYRQNESLALSLQFKITPQLSAGYAYDWITGDVSQLSNGSNELFISYLFKFAENLKSPR